jgi:hypothetical protein
MKLKVLFHDNCFDGACSAALFARFWRETRGASEIVYQGVQHKPGDAFGPDAFDGDENVCVDFRYSRSPRLGWWFDHHVSGFPTPEDRAHFEADRSGQKFYDPAARSCTKFAADTLAAKLGWAPDEPRWREIIHWADLIDGAQFPDAKTAVDLVHPALQLMTWVENNKDEAKKPRFIEDLQHHSLDVIAAAPYVTDALAPLLERHRKHVELITRRARLTDGVVGFDLLDTDVDAHNKFIAYMLFPTCRYTVGLTRSSSRVKISVGSNPWPVVPRTHNIAAICERYGGGGHPVVGAISLPVGSEARARTIAAEITAELQGQALPPEAV